MASYQKRGKTWQYTISRMVNGKSDPIRKGGFRTKKEAMIAAAEVEDSLNKGKQIHIKLVPINDYFKKWVELYKSNLTLATQSHYKNTLRVIEDYFGSTPLQHITKSDYQLFINTQGKDKSLEYVKKLNSHIRSCVQDAMDEGIVHVDFTRKVAYSGKKGKDPEDKHLNYLDTKRLNKALLRKLENERRPVLYIIYLALISGMRFSEIVALTKNDFNFKDNTITVNKSQGYLPTTGMGKKPTKNIASKRVIKIDKRAMSVFEDFIKNTPSNLSGLIFHNPASKYGVYSNTGVNKALKKLLLSLNIEPISLHGLRHTHASILLYKEVSIYYISERLGHADIDTTSKVYAHLLKELKEKDEKKTMDIFEAL